MSRRQAREDAAHRMADAGWPILPCEPGGKRPACEHGFLDATTDHRQIQRWWREDPRFNLGIATGAPGPDVLDVDVHKDGSGYGPLRELKQADLVPAPKAIVRTPSGGAHLYYRGSSQRNGHLEGKHLDYRGTGGYVVGPGSRIAQRTYEVVQRQPSSATFNWAAAKELLDPQPERQPFKPPERDGDRPRDLSHLPGWVASQPEGNRNHGLFWASCRAVEAGDTATLDSLANAARAAGLDEREIGRTIASAQQAAGRAAGRSFEHPPAVPSAATQPDLQAEAAEAGALRPWPASGPVMACDRLTGPRSHRNPLRETRT